MTDSKRRMMPKMLSFRASGAASQSPPRNRISGSAAGGSSSSNNISKLTSKLSPTRLVHKGTKGMRDFVMSNHSDTGSRSRRRTVRPIQSSVASSITCTDFDPSQDLSGLLDDGQDLVIPPPTTNMRRAVSMDSDSKPLRPYRRGSSAGHLEHHQSDYVEPEPSCPLDGMLSCSVNSSITFADFQDLSGLLGDGYHPMDAHAPPPPCMKRAVSMDSDSKPLRPLRRTSQFPGGKMNDSISDQYDYPEPTRNPDKRSESMDSLPIFPSRRDSASVTSVQSRVSQKSSGGRSSAAKSMDCQPSVPGRKGSLVSLGYDDHEVTGVDKCMSVDDQPSMPNRKISMCHKPLVCSLMDGSGGSIPEGMEEEEEESDIDTPPLALTSTDAEMMSVTC